IMAALAIAISSDSSDESVGSPPSRVILFGDIPTVIPSTSVVAPETSTIAPVISSAALVVETTLVASPTRLCGLVPYSGSDSDSPDKMSSPEHISPLPAISPFLCTDSSEDPDSSDGPPSQDPYVATVQFLSDPGRLFLLVDLTALILMGRSETSIEEDTKIDPIKTEVDMELGIDDGDDVRDHVEIDPGDVRDDTEGYEADTSARDTIEVGIDLMSAPIVKEEIVEPVGEDPSDSSGTRDGIVRSFKDMPINLDDVVRNFYHHMSEVHIDRIVGIETAQRRLEADQLIARGQRVSMIERIDSLRLENLKVRAMLDIERGRVNSLRLYMSLSQEEFRQVCKDRDDTRGRLRRLESYVKRRLGFRP
ncbi:hypothetical protein Tco_1497156, partial [Tanacetum coccineum]